jgi:hypothetical protein
MMNKGESGNIVQSRARFWSECFHINAFFSVGILCCSPEFSIDFVCESLHFFL